MRRRPERDGSSAPARVDPRAARKHQTPRARRTALQTQRWWARTRSALHLDRRAARRGQR